MRVVMLEAPPGLLEDRRRLGHDVFDELWDGVLHMVPPPSFEHQRLGARLFAIVYAAAQRRGLLAMYETGLYGSSHDYRVPDQVVFNADQVTEQGARGAELVVEIRSPGDETYDKFDFFVAVGVSEVLVVDPPNRTVELYVLRGGSYRLVAPGAAGLVRSDVLGLSFATGDGPSLLVTPDGGETEAI